ncbi:unnamed protein product [Brachionus calyciflorus]|uniref:Uncharacterized protein n=1 Tax=Brachionus calyciflorus TaxID=104777 RepID=A0A814CLA5_9BILA|nr:unnamed protein product [Brachionus calyciflorus]
MNSSNQFLIETKLLYNNKNNSKIPSFKFLNSEMLSTSNLLSGANNYHLKNLNDSRPFLKNRIKLNRSFKRTTIQTDNLNENEPEKQTINLLLCTGLGQNQTKNESPSPVSNSAKILTRRKSNLSRNKTISQSQIKNFNSIIDGKSLNESKQNTYPSHVSNTQYTPSPHSELLTQDINSYLPNITINSKLNYSITNENKHLISELKEYGQKVLPLNENSIKKIRKLLNLDCFSSTDRNCRQKITNRPKLKIPAFSHSILTEKSDKNNLELSITNIKPLSAINIGNLKGRTNETPITKSSLSTRENENKYADYFYFDESELDNEPIKIRINDKVPPSTPQPESNDGSNEEENCKCLLCEKEEILKEKYKMRQLKKKQKLLKNSNSKNENSMESSSASIKFEMSQIEKNIAENLKKNIQYSSSHPIISVSVKKSV